MKETARFSDNTRILFLDGSKCWKCGIGLAEGQGELHHIWHRGRNKIKSSPFNASLLCHNCHEDITNKDNQMLMRKTFDYLKKQNYILTNIDNQFIKKYYENRKN